MFKNQIDWIPLALGSVRPTQGRTLAVAQVSQQKGGRGTWGGRTRSLAVIWHGYGACCWDVGQVNGGSQSFNVVNILRVLGRWMRMVTIPNQSSVPKVGLPACPQPCDTLKKHASGAGD